MTRETKVGLLVGMGVILLIGILVSDHFTAMKKAETADLAGFADEAQQGLMPRDGRDLPKAFSAEAFPSPTLPGAAGRTTGSADRSVGNPVRPQGPVPMPEDFNPKPRPTEPVRVNPRDLNNPPTVMTLDNLGNPPANNVALPPLPPGTRSGLAANPTPTNPLTATTPMVHTVVKGETLFDIAAKYYNNGDQWKVIAEANPKAFKDGRLSPGTKLNIPNRTQAASATGTSTDRLIAPTPAPANANAGKTITVAAGDTLASIAAKHLGSRAKWADILEINKDKLKKPEDLKLGMELRLPIIKEKAETKLQTTTADATPSSNSDNFTITNPAVATIRPVQAPTAMTITTSSPTPAPSSMTSPTPSNKPAPANVTKPAETVRPATPVSPAGSSSFSAPASSSDDSAAPTVLVIGRPANGIARGAGLIANPTSVTASSAPAATASARTYVVQAGDTLSSIARKMYNGDQSKYDLIYKANRDVLQAEDGLTVGQKLVIPGASGR